MKPLFLRDSMLGNRETCALRDHPIVAQLRQRITRYTECDTDAPKNYRSDHRIGLGDGHYARPINTGKRKQQRRK